ncbi:type I-E CRISPR-associated protein Cas6/Cse3/CasE [Deinococcus ruber]|uniref:type I-E CRISPR-associated protein Cas6/Cse3/CasE n=1 Tax=Deinococcus ruber TaxID=1848197 RepID=UPI003570B8D3
MRPADHVTIHRLELNDYLQAYSAHTVVIRLLAGHPSRALWRLNSVHELIIVTSAPLHVRALGARLRTHVSKPYRPHIRMAEHYEFQVRLHPIKRRDDAAGKEHIRICEDHEIPGFFEPKAAQHGFHPLAYDLRRERGQVIERQHRRVTLPSADFFGILKVSDPEVFQATLLEGIGKKRTFGFGLLQIARC